MTDPIRHLPEGTFPLLPRIHRERQEPQPQERTLPELQLIVGRDKFSSGATLTVTTATGARWPSHRTLWAARWLEPVLTVRGGLEILSRSASRALAELLEAGYFED